jgi:hypothetical protein
MAGYWLAGFFVDMRCGSGTLRCMKLSCSQVCCFARHRRQTAQCASVVKGAILAKTRPDLPALHNAEGAQENARQQTQSFVISVAVLATEAEQPP